MKKYEYFLPLRSIFQGTIFFGFGVFLGLYISADICGGYSCAIPLLVSGKGQFLSREMTLIGFLFLLLGVQRFLVRFQKHNNKIILMDNEIIVPGLLQILPEKKINLGNAERVEREVVGENANFVIKIFFSDGRKPEKIFWSNFMTIEKFDELFSDLKNIVEKKL